MGMREAGDQALQRYLPPIAHRLSSLARARCARAFTMLELLIVISLIAILTSITFVVGRSVIERSRIAQAKAEMAVLAAALEQYKQQYGDYPWTPDGTDADSPALTVEGRVLDGGAILFNALCGNLGPKGNKLTRKGRTFVDLDRFQLTSRDVDSLPELADADDPTKLKVNWFDDPWGGWYWYHYKRGSGDNVASPPVGRWQSKGFLLYSHGPDGVCQVGEAEETGLISSLPTGEEDVEKNRDNIYHGRE